MLEASSPENRVAQPRQENRGPRPDGLPAPLGTPSQARRRPAPVLPARPLGPPGRRLRVLQPDLRPPASPTPARVSRPAAFRAPSRSRGGAGTKDPPPGSSCKPRRVAGAGAGRARGSGGWRKPAPGAQAAAGRRGGCTHRTDSGEQPGAASSPHRVAFQTPSLRRLKVCSRLPCPR